MSTKTSNIIEQLRDYVLFTSDIHGERHWSHVNHIGGKLADLMKLNPIQKRCVEVFAMTHDLARRDDGGGNEHAIEGAEYFSSELVTLFPDIDDLQVDIITSAIKHHSDGVCSEEAFHMGHFSHISGFGEDIIKTVGCCWDADRLDLIRLGILPIEKYMSTVHWEELLPLSERLNGTTRGL